MNLNSKEWDPKIAKAIKAEEEQQNLLKKINKLAFTTEGKINKSFEGLYDVTVRLDKEANDTIGLLKDTQQKIDNLASKVHFLNELYESLAVAGFKKKLQADYASKVEEVNQYKAQKNKALQDIQDNFEKMKAASAK